jgi:hypothetical protein
MLSHDPRSKSMLSSHFPSVAGSLAKWDELVSKAKAAPQTLRTELETRLDEAPGDHPFDLEVLAKGLSDVTERRALDERLGDPLPPMLDGERPLFRVWPDKLRHTGLIAFDEPTTGTDGVVVKFEPGAFPSGGLGERAEILLGPVYSLLQDAQEWPDARNVRYTWQRIDEFPQGDVEKEIRKAQKRIRPAADCPVCGH